MFCLVRRSTNLEPRYIKTWQVCILEEEIESGDAELLDSRFYYRDTDGIGHSTSDLARKIGAKFLSRLSQLDSFIVAEAGGGARFQLMCSWIYRGTHYDRPHNYKETYTRRGQVPWGVNTS